MSPVEQADDPIEETPSPADSVTEGMSSIMWRRRTASTVTPASIALARTAAANTSTSPSSSGGVAGVWSSLTGTWRRKQPANLDGSSVGYSSDARDQRRMSASETRAGSSLRTFGGRE